MRFTPRARGERDFTLDTALGISGLFQSTRPRGARLTGKNVLHFRQDTMGISTTSPLL